MKRLFVEFPMINFADFLHWTSIIAQDAAPAAGPSAFMKTIENSIWIGIGFCAVGGLFTGILLLSRIRKKRFPGAAAEQNFLTEIGECLDKADYDGALAVCDNPGLWDKALPQLTQFAVQARDEPMKKLRQAVVDRFERDILSGLERLNAWVGTAIKTAPQLGLLGTVLGMINAFAKIAGAAATGVDPKELSADISFALWTTAAGMAISIPLIVIQGTAANSIRKLTENIDEGTGILLDDLAAAKTRGSA
ncbi:MAG: MotA/TolQ/ExbB proton channel family protein [Planctomycetaceae bacterium]|jgi:biopolymer transport protein ExbB/TolQ